MDIHFHNTASGKKERFTPIDPNNVRMYACGPTVYDYVHIGNGRSFTTFDQVYRLLRRVYGADHVTYVRNITDIDDKIIARSVERAIPTEQLTNETASYFKQDMTGLGLLEPSHQPRATEFLPQMIKMIERLIEKNNAYEQENHVLFDVRSYSDYGKFSRRSLDELIAGARVDIASYKRDPMDFVLWKPSEGDEPGWDSPWGFGRPGWHTECSCMSETLLGDTFDLHAGGSDLIFPHHQNEIAQSTCAHDGATMANTWIHGGMLQVEGDKMSKSLGNFRTVNDLLCEWPSEAIRLHLISSHYRQQMNFSYDGIREAKHILDRWYRLTENESDVGEDEIPNPVLSAAVDDLNIPQALTEMHKLAGGEDVRGLKASAQFLGLMQQTAEEWAAWRPADLDIDETKIEALIAARKQARANKDFTRADEIRDELQAMNIELKDSAEGTTWTIAS